MAKKPKKDINEITDRIVTVMFGDHGSFGWNAETRNPGVTELFCDKKLSEAKKLAGAEMLVAKFKAQLLKEILEDEK